jgi:hypothetical protein
MKFLLLLVLLLQVAPLYAIERSPLSRRTALAQRPMNEASSTSAAHAWKLGLIGLAALSFLIRKRL